MESPWADTIGDWPRLRKPKKGWVKAHDLGLSEEEAPALGAVRRRYTVDGDEFLASSLHPWRFRNPEAGIEERVDVKLYAVSGLEPVSFASAAAGEVSLTRASALAVFRKAGTELDTGDQILRLSPITPGFMCRNALPGNWTTLANLTRRLEKGSLPPMEQSVLLFRQDIAVAMILAEGESPVGPQAERLTVPRELLL